MTHTNLLFPHLWHLKVVLFLLLQKTRVGCIACQHCCQVGVGMFLSFGMKMILLHVSGSTTVLHSSMIFTPQPEHLTLTKFWTSWCSIFSLQEMQVPFQSWSSQDLRVTFLSKVNRSVDLVSKILHVLPSTSWPRPTAPLRTSFLIWLIFRRSAA